MNYYNEIKDKLLSNKIYKKAKDYSKNKNDLETYYDVGKLIIEAQGGEARARYGDNLIKEYSKKLTKDLGKGYSTRTLKDMRKFYLYCEKGHALRAELSWTHYRELLRLKEHNQIEYYINICLSQNLSYRELINKIKSKEYERLPEETRDKLIEKEEIKVNEYIKNPIIIKNKYNYQEITEKMLKQLILEDLSSFMKELGDGYSFIDSEYKIKIGNRYNYMDLLLFNYIYNCFVVVELKVTELKKEHIGQIGTYMNYIDKNLKNITQNKTIGIIVCKRGNKFIMQYCSDNRIFETEFIFN